MALHANPARTQVHPAERGKEGDSLQTRCTTRSLRTSHPAPTQPDTPAWQPPDDEPGEWEGGGGRRRARSTQDGRSTPARPAP
eukprot:3147778-Alexandrium_andersonii.AAC.1